MRHIPERLAMVLENPRILKAGRLVSSDLRQVQDTFKHARMFCGALDLAKFAKERHATSSAKCSLADLCASILGKRLNKNVSERMSTAWERRKLTEEQRRYAACDAYIPLLLYDRLSTLAVPQKLVDPLLPGTPVLLYNANSITIIAHGRLSTPDVHPPIFDNVRLTKSHILIEILDVCVPGAIINSHKKRALNSFGPAPFSLVCLWSCTRSYDPLTTLMPDGAAISGAQISAEPAPELESPDDFLDDDPADDGAAAGDLMQEAGDISTSIRVNSSFTPADRDAESEMYGGSVLSSISATPWPTVI